MTTYLSYRVPAICCYTMSESFFAVSYGYYALRVAVPGYIVYATGYDMVFTYPAMSVLERRCRIGRMEPLVFTASTASHTFTDPETSPDAM